MSRQRRQMFTEINITPLTDIFLVLLIIMMVIAPMLDSQGLRLAVPTVSPSEETKDEPKALTVHVTTDGQYLVDNQPLAAEMIQQKLYQTKGQYPDGLIIETDPQALHGMMVKVMDAARSAGIEKIAVTESEGAAGQP
jgi:biopolymer transport protein ExbD